MCSTNSTNDGNDKDSSNEKDNSINQREEWKIRYNIVLNIAQHEYSLNENNDKDSSNEKDNSINQREEWKVRYDIALNIAQHEYSLAIERIKNIDEKIEKFLVVAVAFIAAIVAILSGSLINSLSIYNNSTPWAHFINGAIVLLIIHCLYLTFLMFDNFLKGLRVAETRRMPNTIDLIHDAKDASLEWTYSVIEFYENARNFLNVACNNKIEYLKKGQDTIQKQIQMLLAIVLLIFLKTIFIK